MPAAAMGPQRLLPLIAAVRIPMALIPMALIALALTGCATRASNQQVLVAAEAVEQARSSRVVRALAAFQLNQAEIALAHARAAWDDDQAGVEVDHLAYLAGQRAAIAHARAAERVAQEEIKALNVELEQLQRDSARPTAELARRAPGHSVP